MSIVYSKWDGIGQDLEKRSPIIVLDLLNFPILEERGKFSKGRGINFMVFKGIANYKIISKIVS